MPRSFVSSVYRACPGPIFTRSFESSDWSGRRGAAPRPRARLHVGDVEDAGRLVRTARCSGITPRTGPASPAANGTIHSAERDAPARGAGVRRRVCTDAMLDGRVRAPAVEGREVRPRAARYTRAALGAPADRLGALRPGPPPRSHEPGRCRFKGRVSGSQVRARRERAPRPSTPRRPEHVKLLAKLARREQLLADVRPADELTADEDLRDRRPAGDGGQP